MYFEKTLYCIIDVKYIAAHIIPCFHITILLSAEPNIQAFEQANGKTVPYILIQFI